MHAIELFAGAGGLALGVSTSGFHPTVIVEWDRWCCDTIRRNRLTDSSAIAKWPEPIESDVRKISFKSFEGAVDLVTGGPPCQPFSLGGKHKAHDDQRDMWPQAVRAVRVETTSTIKRCSQDAQNAGFWLQGVARFSGPRHEGRCNKTPPNLVAMRELSHKSRKPAGFP